MLVVLLEGVKRPIDMLLPMCQNNCLLCLRVEGHWPKVNKSHANQRPHSGLQSGDSIEEELYRSPTMQCLDKNMPNSVPKITQELFNSFANVLKATRQYRGQRLTSANLENSAVECVFENSI